MNDPLWPRASDWLAERAADPRLGVLGVPISIGSITPSEAWRAPQAMRRALQRFSTFDGEGGVDLAHLPVLDVGDLDVARMELDTALEAARDRAADLDRHPVWAFLGGDNSITRPLVTGLAADRPGGVGVITLDAHHDVRSLDQGPRNGTPIRGLLEDGVRGDRIVQIGIHTFANSEPYRRFCDENGIRIFTMGDVEDHGIDAVVDRALGMLSPKCDWVYVDFDIDVLDRVFAPACPGARPGGLTPRTLYRAARRFGLHRSVRAADFVEVDPTRDRDDVTVMAMAMAFLSFASGVASRIEEHG